MTHKRETVGLRRFGSHVYTRTPKPFRLKADATRYANRYRKRAKTHRARVVKAATHGWLVFKNPPTRKQVLTGIRVAGYRNDDLGAIRLYVENRVSYKAYQDAWRKGVAQRKGTTRR